MIFICQLYWLNDRGLPHSFCNFERWIQRERWKWSISVELIHKNTYFRILNSAQFSKQFAAPSAQTGWVTRRRSMIKKVIIVTKKSHLMVVNIWWSGPTTCTTITMTTNNTTGDINSDECSKSLVTSLWRVSGDVNVEKIEEKSRMRFSWIEMCSL